MNCFGKKYNKIFNCKECIVKSSCKKDYSTRLLIQEKLAISQKKYLERGKELKQLKKTVKQLKDNQLKE